jgi:mono/diheme cytochrome c family protein
VTTAEEVFLKLVIRNNMKSMVLKSIYVSLSVLLFGQQLFAQDLAKGKKVYETRCLVCHQADGGGVPNMNAPLDGSTNVVGNNIARLVKIIKKGYSEKIALDGYYYSNVMTPNPDLSDADIANVLSYIRTSWSNKASKVTLAQVQASKNKK